MGNTLITPQAIARESLIVLRENLTAAASIHKNYESDPKDGGETVAFKKPPILEGKIFNPATGIEIQDVKEETVTATLDIADVSVEFGAKERAMSLPNYKEKFIVPAMEALAQTVDQTALLEMSVNTPYHGGTPATTPDELADIAAAARVLNDLKAPLSRRTAIWNAAANEKFTTIPAIVNAEKSGSTAALREGSIGRVQGFNNFMSQNIPTHTAGGAAAATTPLATGSAGATTIAIAATAMTGKLLKGDLLDIAGNQYVVTADTENAAANAIASVPIYPALKATASSAAVTFYATHVNNLAFHEKAAALVIRPLQLPSDKQAYIVTFEGLALRVTIGYDMKYKKDTCSMDLLFGVKMLQPELCVRYLG